MGKKSVTLINKKTIDTLLGAGLVGGGAVSSTFMINKIPFIKDQKPWVKALTQAGVTLLGLSFIKNKGGQQFISGSAVGAAISLIIPYMPEGFRLGSKSGRTFTKNELSELQSVGRPIKLQSQSTMHHNLGRPVKITSLNNSRVGHSSRGKRGYAAY